MIRFLIKRPENKFGPFLVDYYTVIIGNELYQTILFRILGRIISNLLLLKNQDKKKNLNQTSVSRVIDETTSTDLCLWKIIKRVIMKIPTVQIREIHIIGLML